MTTIALIDGDIVIHRCAAALDRPVEQMKSGVYRFNLPAAIKNIKGILRDIAVSVGADRSVICISDRENFRKEVFAGYKGHRRDRKPILFAELRQKLLDSDKFETVVKPRLEADDVMGIIATGTFKKYRGDKIICTIDKDLRTIPGQHWNWDKQIGGIDEPEWVDEDEADRGFYRQALSGDSSDGYPGVPGVGPKAAEKLIPDDMSDEEEMWAAVVGAYEAQGLTEDDAILNARCARILRACDYRKGEPILWTPPRSTRSTSN